VEFAREKGGPTATARGTGSGGLPPALKAILMTARLHHGSRTLGSPPGPDRKCAGPWAWRFRRPCGVTLFGLAMTPFLLDHSPVTRSRDASTRAGRSRPRTAACAETSKT